MKPFCIPAYNGLMSFTEFECGAADTCCFFLTLSANHNQSAIYANSLEPDETPSNSSEYKLITQIAFSSTLSDIGAL